MNMPQSQQIKLPNKNNKKGKRFHHAYREDDSSPSVSSADSDHMITMTKKLITKLKLKPKYKESAYSQAFINREREVAEKLLKRTKVRIEHKTPVYLQ